VTKHQIVLEFRTATWFFVGKQFEFLMPHRVNIVGIFVVSATPESLLCFSAFLQHSEGHSNGSVGDYAAVKHPGCPHGNCGIESATTQLSGHK